MERRQEWWVWRGGRGEVGVGFVGRGPRPADRQLALRAAEAPPGVALAWMRQVHSAVALRARAGDSGQGDALICADSGLALAVGTADCVPVLLASRGRIGAVHAGWRGLASGVLAAAVAALGRESGELAAWIGPAIGACCYEVGDEVAAQVAAASGGDAVVNRQANGRPHLDLQRAAARQLRALGAEPIVILSACTRCQSERLWSYRRDGAAAGRNFAFIWQTS